MSWWDGLWLNESFAQFISQFAIGQINSTLLNPLQPATIYFRNDKQSGYEDDERNTATHPINQTVPDTSVA
jgi:aminopeptidase N